MDEYTTSLVDWSEGMVDMGWDEATAYEEEAGR